MGLHILKHDDICEVTCVDKDKVKHVKDSVSHHNTMAVAQIFKALSDA
jgi:hypothetical protein